MTLAHYHPSEATLIPCQTDQDCSEALKPFTSSHCSDGFCSNPFYTGGCLAQYKDTTNYWRVCHSDDPPDAAQQGHCWDPNNQHNTPQNYNNTTHSKLSFRYREVRVAHLGWESATFGAWILQIVLSELLGVPVTLESGGPNLAADFYQPQSRLDPPEPQSAEVLALRNAFEAVDCAVFQEQNQKAKGAADYMQCAHVAPELWKEGDGMRLEIVENGWGEYVELGALAEQYWYIPKYVAEQDPTLGTYSGLVGEKNRRKLAETFLTPTSWKDYCDHISNSTCEEPDNVAQRYPQTPPEENSFFIAGSYTGHFRKTPEQDCDLNNATCYGHIADYPCDWASFLPIQAHHLGIALKSTGPDPVGGYSYSQLTQIWAAGNATRSPVMMMWWNPEYLWNRYLGTEYEFTHVVLPPPTASCKASLEEYNGRCTLNDPEAQYASPELAAGTCDYAPQSLRKMISTSLQELAQDPEEPSELWSPAYDVIRNYQLTELHMGEIFQNWQTMENNGGDTRLNLRRATCQWVGENLDLVDSWIPDSYPRTMVEQDFRTLNNDDKNGAYTAAFVVAFVVSVLLVLTLTITFWKRNTKIIYFLRLEWFYFVQLGLLFIAVGAWLIVIPQSQQPNDFADSSASVQCVASVWLFSAGYGWLLTPLLLRINAIYRLQINPRKTPLHRVKVGKRKLLKSLALVTIIVMCYLLIWSLIDPPSTQAYYSMPDGVMEGGKTVVTKSEYCSSDSSAWMVANVGWQLLLVMSASIVTFMASNRFRKDLNETRLLSSLIFVHLLFGLVRFALVTLRDSIADPIDLMAIFSLVMTCECVASLAIFVIPKLVQSYGSNNITAADEHLPELYMNCTIMYAHLAGFEAWSSVREASQVFEFLDVLYSAFDEIADKRGVFKVESSESYVAATGIPIARNDHALQMARFAMDIAHATAKKCKELEIVYGEGTAELAIQIGLHSGAVTGGLMQGSRFQLIGGTASLAKQVSATSERRRIQVTQETANHLIRLGRSSWLHERDELINLKGSGNVKMYWLGKGTKNPSLIAGETGSGSEIEFISSSDGELYEISHEMSGAERKRRLVNWNIGILHQLLKQIYARRMATVVRSLGHRQGEPSVLANLDVESAVSMNAKAPLYPDQQQPFQHGPANKVFSAYHSGTEGYHNETVPLDEVKEIIPLPTFDRKIAKRQTSDMEEIEIPTIVLDQLQMFVSKIGDLYNDNPFHCFAHASHVVMSTMKHLNRIVAPNDLEMEDESDQYVKTKAAAALHDHTYGITSDPLTQFACVFAALIHDVDHPGIPNIRLVKEDPDLAVRFRGRSVAEQNAFTIAWDLLMKDEFAELLAGICGDHDGLARFRQLVINSLMATDLGDRELRKLRNGRWDRAFKTCTPEEEAQVDNVNRKATIVIEHLIQAADVSHTTQHYDVYREWSAFLFQEMYFAFREGRADTNPSDFWYEGEIGFFDHYVIPLSKKLSDCGVFGISSDENLSYATRNRELWMAGGKAATEEIHQKCKEAWESMNPEEPEEAPKEVAVAPPPLQQQEEGDDDGGNGKSAAKDSAEQVRPEENGAPPELIAEPEQSQSSLLMADEPTTEL